TTPAMREQITLARKREATARKAENKAAEPEPALCTTRLVTQATRQTVSTVNGKKARSKRACTDDPVNGRNGDVRGPAGAINPTPRTTNASVVLSAIGMTVGSLMNSGVPLSVRGVTVASLMGDGVSNT